ncbi:MAG: transposase [Paludibacter sp.]|nr:transposase [Paludibacter sp.]
MRNCLHLKNISGRTWGEFAADVEQNNQRVKQNPAYYKQRQQLAEHPWGTLKRQRGFDYVLTRGKKNVLGEVSLVFIGYNLSRFMQITEGINTLKELIKGMIALLCWKRACFKPI